MSQRISDLIARRAQRADIYSAPTFWNGKARSYSGSAVSMWKNQTLNACYEREQFSFIDKVMRAPLGLDVLDMGCGTGRLSRHLASRGANVTAFDFADEVVRIAKSQNSSDKINYRVQSSFDISEISTYDIVVAIGNLTVACKTPDDVENIVQRVHRALRPNGQFIVVEPFHDSFLSRVLHLTARDYVELLERAGFRIGQRCELHFWPVRLPLCLVDWPGWVTKPAYYAGQALLACGGEKLGFGDYKGISATKVL